MKKVVITSRSFGSVSNEPFELLESEGFLCEFLENGLDREKVFEIMNDADAIIAGTGKLDAELIKACKNLKIIARYGAGVDNVCLETAKKRGISVTSTAGVNANAVADLAFGLILDARRGISRANSQVHKGTYKVITGHDVWKKTLGLVGFGAIAQAVARRAGGFSMEVLAFDPYAGEVAAEFSSYVRLCDFEELVACSDVVSIHAPLTSETKGMFNEHTIFAMKKDAVIINLGRGGIIDEAGLYKCMKEGHLFGAGLDVTVNEPVNMDNPLLTLDNVTITPHMGIYSQEVISEMSMVCARNVVNKFLGKELKLVVC
ncbi:MAG: phosphoglycerate dehydrogenase [Oscillospiraceae bacterium]|nr:phosphoglycerate dehydrogenase [Oscillospiraceae bacterium]